MSRKPPTSGAPNSATPKIERPLIRTSVAGQCPRNLTPPSYDQEAARGLTIGWPVHPEIRYKESAKGGGCFSRLGTGRKAGTRSLRERPGFDVRPLQGRLISKNLRPR